MQVGRVRRGCQEELSRLLCFTSVGNQSPSEPQAHGFKLCWLVSDLLGSTCLLPTMLGVQASIW